MRKNRSLAILSGSLIFCLGIYILFQGGTQITEEWKWSLRENLVRMTERSFMPGLFYAEKEEKTDWNTWIAKKAMQMIPLGSYVEGKGTYESEIEEINMAGSKGVYHKNTCARKVSRLTKAVNGIA